MPKEMFKQLTANIRKAGRLESLPFCARNDAGDVEIVSGHHRVNAALAAGIEAIPVLLQTRPLSKAQLRAKQAAHNSIGGRDDAQVLKMLWAEMDDLEARIESYLDPRAFEKLQLDIIKPIDLQVDTEQVFVGIAFLPHQAEQFDQLIARIAQAQVVHAEPSSSYELFRDTVERIRKEVKVKKLGGILAVMCQLAQAELDRRAADAEVQG